MNQQIHITLDFELATGKVTLNEIVYRLEQLKNPLMLEVLKAILTSYDDLIAQRLSPQSGVMSPGKRRKGLGRHRRKGDPENRFCHGRRIRKRGYRKHPRTIATIFGKLRLLHPGGRMPRVWGAVFALAGGAGDDALQPQGKQLRTGRR